MAGWIEQKPATVMARVVVIPLLTSPENILLLNPGAIADFSSHDHRHRCGALSPELGVRQVQPAVFRIIRMSDQIEEPTVLLDVGFRRAANRGGLKPPVLDDAEFTDAIADE